LSFKDWVFDLDNTLYPASSSLFPQIHERMGTFIADALKVDLPTAHEMQRNYYRTYGTTLRGLMLEHALPPDDFLAFVHEIDCTVLGDDPRLEAALARIPGRKLVFTNGSARHAENVLGHLGLAKHFDGVFDIKAADYIPKPAAETYHRMIKQFGVDPKQAVMFEDLAHNLAVPAQLGMTTVWVREEGHSFAEGPDPEDLSFIDHVTDDLAGWIDDWVTKTPAKP
jgi:putative hydrolase of the HAD superfamily